MERYVERDREGKRRTEGYVKREEEKYVDSYVERERETCRARKRYMWRERKRDM